jgi:hypothetical protein
VLARKPGAVKRSCHAQAAIFLAKAFKGVHHSRFYETVISIQTIAKTLEVP